MAGAARMWAVRVEETMASKPHAGWVVEAHMMGKNNFLSFRVILFLLHQPTENFWLIRIFYCNNHLKMRKIFI